MKKILKVLLIAAAALVGLVACLFGWLTATQLNTETAGATLNHASASTESLEKGGTLSILSWNIGYAGLGENEDFFMDGGEMVRPDSKETVEKYLAGIIETLKDMDTDLYVLQEVDGLRSTRTYGIIETETIANALSYDSAYALNYKCDFVPFPWPPLGKIGSGIMTLSSAPIESAERIALPSPFSWPVSVANLKRCMCPSYIDVEGTDAQLVLVNVHLEAYDNGEGKIAQTKMLLDFIQSEYEKGNYVIVGGDFNQTFPGALEDYPMIDGSLWTPGTLEADMLPEGWSFAYDTTVPTCRLLNQPYDPESPNTQYYVIDGFILSPNVELCSVETQDMHFENSDHNPVLMSVRLK